MAIKRCNCKSGYQDKKYGFQNRVHNQAQNKATNMVDWVCTICGRRQSEKGE